MAELREDVDAALHGWAGTHLGSHDVLSAAMRDALLSPGKRVRPVLTLLVGRLYRTGSKRLIDLALIPEVIHAASLVLDDLPSMDDAPVRRGRPSLHMKYGEATAILAAFDLLGRAHAALPAALIRARIPKRRLFEAQRELDAVIDSLCHAQVRDLEAGATTVEQLEEIHAGKTGALFVLAASWGALAGRATEVERLAIEAFARNLGLAFQVVDDVLDVAGRPERLGKPISQDASRVTFVDLVGVGGARQLARELAATAAGSLDLFGDRAATLMQFAEGVVSRDT